VLRITAWVAGGGLIALIVAGLAIRGLRLVVGPQFLRPGAEVAATSAPESPGDAFVSQSKAELAHENALKALGELRRLPQDHPALLQRFILIEKAFIGGESILRMHEYATAYKYFSELNKEIDDFSLSVKLKQETQKSYDEVLLRIKELERARSLAPQEFETAFADAGMGRQLFTDGNFSGSKKQFDAAFAALNRANQALKDYVEGNLRTGLELVAKGSREEALAAFRAALEKDPGNEQGMQGLKRAEVSDQVRALLLKAASLEEKKEYAQAKESYARAFELDAFSAVAQQGKSRAERLEKETEFNQALAQAVAFRDEGLWAKAISAYERALKVTPQDKNVQKALADTKETAHRESVKTALAKAVAYENKYEWEQARGAYHETMELDPNHADAKDGYFRTGKMIRSLMQYNKLVDIAETAAQRAEFQTAIRNFNEAMAVKPAYLALNDRAAQLRNVLNLQSKPVEVTFRSDGNCWVSISNFRMLGKISTQTIKMLPGDYEIVSRRKGYQDVLLQLQVRNGSTPPVVSVACTLRTNG
jgi:tetratricopeptide (TPR) repeat protein